MELQEPVLVYTAAKNLEAHDVAEWLRAAKISSHVVEDLAIAAWAGGLNTTIHRPQVWVSKSQQQEAIAEIQKYEDRLRARRVADLAKIARDQTVLLSICEQCGESAEFPIEQSGSVQRCWNCGAYIDVDEDPGLMEWDVGQPEPPPPESRFFE